MKLSSFYESDDESTIEVYTHSKSDKIFVVFFPKSDFYYILDENPNRIDGLKSKYGGSPPSNILNKQMSFDSLPEESKSFIKKHVSSMEKFPPLL